LRYGLVTRRHPQDGVVGRLQNPGFPADPATLLRGFDFYPGGTVSHWTRQPLLDAHFNILRQLFQQFVSIPTWLAAVSD
jgi:hypothetical protein